MKEMANDRWSMTFGRWLTFDKMIQVNKLRNMLQGVTLTLDEEDSPKWSQNKSGKFTLKSIYNHISNIGPDRSFKHLWKAKIPMKIKIQVWFIWHNAIATKYNMIRRKWAGDPFFASGLILRSFNICVFVPLLPSKPGV